MSLTLIELSDYYLTLTQGDKKTTQLGCCLVQTDELIFGNEAWQQQLLSPQQIYCNYWQQLGYEKVYSDNVSVEHFADLAYLQLKEAIKEFDQVDEVVLLVSGHYCCEQLALLLGIVEACELTVIRLINTSVVQAASFLSDKKCNKDCLTELLFLDIDLHQATVSELSVNGEAKLSQFQSFHQKGLLDLIKHLAVWINEFFIIEYRYDVFDCAHTEQSLLNQITELLSLSQTNYQIIIHDALTEEKLVNAAITHDVEPSISTTGTARSTPDGDKLIAITEQLLQQQIQLFFSDIFDELADKKQILMSEKIANILAHTPKAVNWKIVSGTTVYPFVNDAMSKEIAPEKIELVSHLALSFNDEQGSLVNDDSLSEELATHIMYQGIIYPLEQDSCYLPHRNANLQPAATLKKYQQQWFLQLTEQSNSAVYVNEKPASEGQRLMLGDQIKLAQSNEIYVLAVLKGSGGFYGV